MKPLLPLFIVLFCLSSLAFAYKSCTISFWGPNPPPVCETYTDENGQEEESCYQLGAPQANAILDARTPSFTFSDEVAEVDWYGDCRCTLVVWSKPNYKGACKLVSNNKRDSAIIIEDIWSRTANSFKVACRF